MAVAGRAGRGWGLLPPAALKSEDGPLRPAERSCWLVASCKEVFILRLLKWEYVLISRMGGDACSK